MLTKRFLLTLLTSATLFTVACHKDQDDQPQPAAPAQAATLNMTFHYTNPDETRGINHLADKPSGQQLADRLVVTFSNSQANPVDQIEFTIAKSRQKSGLAGTYALASQPDPGAGDVQVRYLRPTPSSAAIGNLVTGNTHRLTGSFIISSYDANRQLISGSYTVEAADSKDPFTFLTTGVDNRRSGDLRVYGTFTEVPLR
ncbi:hypothetical protein [Hymenobacter yonginensis]|uniref:Uncharacterized protein n=1 Tax=Hymenobacter yonginensis TaxID=748197 RepID=A0ABY7PLL6_9BACT|nr:hypothetical protein [Hymenobacter yonginensis]WBO83681.1 hypothetical protein O9Z63_15025 [Hymenobacter yonginensis]